MGSAGSVGLRWGGLQFPVRLGLRLPDRFLDRLIGGRAWIAVIAFALIGIVGMQLWVVKLGVGIGRAVEHTQLLQQENSALSAEDSALSSGERTERLALAKGMVPASPAVLHFDTLRGPLDARLAAAALAKPVQTQTTGSTSVGAETSAETSTGSAGAEPSTGSAGAEPSSSATTSATANPTSTTPTGGEATGTEATGTEATSTQAPTTPETTAAQAPTPAAEAAPTATGDSTEAAGASLGSGGGTQAPGG